GYPSPVPEPNVNPVTGGNTGAGNVVEDGSFDWATSEFIEFFDTTDFMGTGNGWTDAQTWNYLKRQFGVSSARIQAVTPQGQFLIAQGSVLRNGSGSFTNCYTILGADLASPSQPGSHSLLTLDDSS